MSALAEALLAAQRQAIGALSKAYVAKDEYGHEWVMMNLDAIGCTDAIEQERLLASLDILRALGVQASEANGKPAPETEPASERQTAYIRKLADERNMIAPDGTLNKDQASKVIEQLKAGTYNADEWTAPF